MAISPVAGWVHTEVRARPCPVQKPEASHWHLKPARVELMMPCVLSLPADLALDDLRDLAEEGLQTVQALEV